MSGATVLLEIAGGGGRRGQVHRNSDAGAASPYLECHPDSRGRLKDFRTVYLIMTMANLGSGLM